MTLRSSFAYHNFTLIKDHLIGVVLLFGIIVSIPLSSVYAKENKELLTLKQSIRIAMNSTPEMKVAEAQIGSQQGKLSRINVWPNPSVSVQMDNVLGIEDASGGYDITELAISQPIPLYRLKHQQKQAELGIAKAKTQYQHQQFLLEFKVAKLFHDLQLKKSTLVLAKKRLQQIRRHQNTNREPNVSDHIVRYLTPLEIMRLDIVLQTAKQTVAVAEGKYNEAASSFKSLLGLPLNQSLYLPKLKPVTASYKRKVLDEALQNHPALKAKRQGIEEAQAGIAVAESQLFSDPVVTLYRRNEYLANQRHAVTGLAVSIDLPFWNQNQGSVVEAQYAVQQTQAELDIKQRELRTSLYKSYLHLGHLIEQAKHYQNKVLKPAKKMFKLTQSGFEVGELSVLTLLDAYNTYFDALSNHKIMLTQAWQELAALRLSAGISLVQPSKIMSTLEKES
ncbi:MAG: TolC family protein [Ghiorsea sp.]|nr:TolC family protein [Ghiorsea sp.]